MGANTPGAGLSGRPTFTPAPCPGLVLDHMPKTKTERTVYFAHEIAGMLGCTTEHLYRKGVMEKLYAQGFPESILLGRYRFPRDRVDAWFARRPRSAAPANANDPIAAPPIAHEPDERQRAFLHAAYAPQRG